MSSIKLHTHPYLVLSSFTQFVIEETRDVITYLVKKHLVLSAFVVLFSVLLTISNQIKGPHQVLYGLIQQQAFWYGTWFFLGVSSSIAVGAGFHTFILFLGPYIAEVTLAAYECHSTDLLMRNPDSFRLNECVYNDTYQSTLVLTTVWTVFQKVKWESFAWGAGTAFGELPPYFIARAVTESEDKMKAFTNSSSGRKERMLEYMFKMIQKLGFFGILLFASIPNPLFDLAGITCGHFKVPFTTFFGATFLGKACVKATIQSLLVILVFSHDTITIVLEFIKTILPRSLYHYIEISVQDQSNIFKNDTEDQITLTGTIWNCILGLMITYYIFSSIESLGVAYISKTKKKSLHTSI